MTIVSNTFTINIINDAKSVNDAPESIIDDSRVTPQILAYFNKAKTTKFRLQVSML